MAMINAPLLDTPKASHHKTICIVLSSVAILSSTTLVTIHYTKISPTTPPLPLQNLCDHAPDQASYLAKLVAQIASNTTIKMNHGNLLQFLLENSTPDIQNFIDKAKDVSRQIDDPREQAALVDCVELMELSVGRIKDSIVDLESVTFNPHVNAHARLRSVLANCYTCLDRLNGSARSTIEPDLNDLIISARISLAILLAISPSKNNYEIFPLNSGDFPPGLTSEDRKLIENLPKDIKAEVVVAEDRRGKYKTFVVSVPNDGKTGYVIYVQKEKYEENVEVGKKKMNVILGDGNGNLP